MLAGPKRNAASDGSIKSQVLEAIPQYVRLQRLRRNLALERLSPDDFVFKLATTTEELGEAYKLLHDCYVNEGYMKPSPSGLRCTIYHALPTSTVLVGKYRGRVVTTVTLFKDSDLGLPSDKDFGLENDGFRREEHQLCEVSSLATHPDFRGGDVTFHLIKYLWNYATDLLGVTMLCCVVNPRAVDFYKAFLNFDQNGAEISYDFVDGARGAHLARDLRDHREWMREQFDHLPTRCNLYRFFYEEPSPFQYPNRSSDFLVDPVLTPAMLAEFFAVKTDVFSTATPEQIAIVRSAYAVRFEAELTRCHVGTGVARVRDYRYPTAIRATLDHENLVAFGLVSDLSAGGFFFRTLASLEIGRVYRINLVVGDEQLSFPVELRWQAGGELSRGYGARFLVRPDSLIEAMSRLHSAPQLRESSCR